MEAERIYFNGIDAGTGQYLRPPMTLDELASQILSSPPLPDEEKRVIAYWSQRASEISFEIKEGVDLHALDQAGWGVIFPASFDPASKEALGELLEHRKGMAGQRYKEFTYRPGETIESFLERHGIGPGPVDPDQIPYYLLLVGSPQEIPFEFQSRLSLQYAVGRVDFESAQDYGVYARSLLALEGGELWLSKEAALWVPVADHDPLNQISESAFLDPINKAIQSAAPDWRFDMLHHERANKRELSKLLNGPSGVSLLLASAHGLGFQPGDPRQMGYQGALLGSDWPGPQDRQGRVPEDFYFSAADLNPEGRLAGLVTFLLGSYSTGTPEFDPLPNPLQKSPARLAPQPFTAGLPRRLLAHPLGGVLGVIGYSGPMLWAGLPQLSKRMADEIGAFTRLLGDNYSLGHALLVFQQSRVDAQYRYTQLLEDMRYGKSPNPGEVVETWAAATSGRFLTLLGDPAGRLPLAPNGATSLERPRIEIIHTIHVEGKTEPAEEPQPSEQVPPTQAEAAQAAMARARQILAGFAADTARGEDQLGIEDDVLAFSRVMAAKEVRPPLCIGLFGDWGSGKSFFIHQLEKKIEELAAGAEAAEKKKRPTPYCSRVVQITFNAWHYMDGDLWASLISFLFEEIDKYLHEFEEEEQRKNLLKKLDTAQKLLEEAKIKKGKANQECQQAAEDLQKLKAEREQSRLSLQQARKLVLDGFLNQNPDLKKAVNTLADRLGMPQIAQSGEELAAVIQQMGSLRTRLGAFWVAMVSGPGAWQRWALLLGLVILVPLLPLAVNWVAANLLQAGALSQAGALITELAALVAGLAAWANRHLKTFSDALTELEKGREKVDQMLQESRANPSEKEKQALNSLTTLEERQKQAEKELSEAQANFAEAQRAIQELENLEDTRRLADFIQERAASQDYRSRLGIISLIRSDLQALSTWVDPINEKRREAPENLPRVDRLILYIDDLDRCPEERVVKVLQAIHLLLAFPLFVVVVAVDPRWLLHSLEQAYPTLQAGLTEGSGWLEEEKLAWETTPQNYVEKIFQIPYNLRPMEAAGFKRLVDSILVVPDGIPSPLQGDGREKAGSGTADRPAVQEGAELPQPGEEIPAEVAAQEGGTPPPGDGSSEAVEVPAQAQTGSLPTSYGETPTDQPVNRLPDNTPTPGTAQPEEQPAEGEQPPTGGTTPPKPEEAEAEPETHANEPEAPAEGDLIGYLSLDPAEQVFIEHFSDLIPTPRATKRFINIYRIIRSKIPAEALPAFVGDSDNPGEFQAVMILLALLTGTPRYSPYLFRKILNSDPRGSWRGILGSLKPYQRPGNENLFYNGVIDSITRAEASGWKRLHQALNELQAYSTLDDEMATYQRWAPQVARFSFRVGKAFTYTDLSPVIRIRQVGQEPDAAGTPCEYVLIENSGDTSERLGGWTLSDRANHTYRFPDFTLRAGSQLRVWTGPGQDGEGDLYWNRKASVWNNDGDEAFLRDANGSLVSSLVIEKTPKP